MVQLVGRASRLDVTAEEPDELPGLILGAVRDMTVVVEGLPVLCTFELHTQLVVEMSESRGNISSGRDSRGSGGVDLRVKGRMEAEVHKERRLLGRLALMVIEGERREREVVDPVILLVGDIGPEVGLKRLVSTLGEAVSLRMIGSQMLEVCARQGTKLCPKLRDKVDPWSEIMDEGRPW